MIDGGRATKRRDEKLGAEIKKHMAFLLTFVGSMLRGDIRKGHSAISHKIKSQIVGHDCGLSPVERWWSFLFIGHQLRAIVCDRNFLPC
jgi:hypothetical protein